MFEMWHDKMELNSLLSMLHDTKKKISTLNSILCESRWKMLVLCDKIISLKIEFSMLNSI